MDNRFNNEIEFWGAKRIMKRDNYPNLQCVINMNSSKTLYIEGLKHVESDNYDRTFRDGLPDRRPPKCGKRSTKINIQDCSHYALHKRDYKTPNNIIQRRKTNITKYKTKNWNYDKDDWNYERH